jgi:IS5 family transposase
MLVIHIEQLTITKLYIERNRLKGTLGDAINAILSAAAMNFQKLQGFSWRFLLRLMDQLHHAITSDPIASSA